MPDIEDLFLGGASSLLSNGINYAFQSMAANRNYQLGQRAAQAQYERQLDFWHQQNAYNSPEAQVNRRLAAGLSPVESVDSGNASQLSSVPGNEVGKSGALQFQSSIDLLESMRTIQDIRNLGKTGNRLDAEVSNLIAEGLLLDLEKKLKSAGLDEMAERLTGIRLVNERERKANKYLYTEEYYTNSLNTLVANLKKLSADANISTKDWNYYDVKGVHPNRVGTSSERVLINAIDSLLNIVSGGKLRVKDLIGDKSFEL